MDDEQRTQLHKDKIKKEFNTTSTIFKVIAGIIFFLAFICFCILAEDSAPIAFASLLVLLFSGFIFIAIAELFQILHDIRRKLYEKK